MTYNPEIHHRRSVRLKEYNYSSCGAYFITICVQGRESLFGKIVAEEMQLNNVGRMVAAVWHELPGRFPHVSLDEFVVMPNHVHGIIIIQKNGGTNPVRPIHELPLQQDSRKCHDATAGRNRRKMVLPSIIGYFKMNSAKKINQIRNTPGVPVWQRNYFDRVIRDENELAAVQEYIHHNPLRWVHDEENPTVTIM